MCFPIEFEVQEALDQTKALALPKSWSGVLSSNSVIRIRPPCEPVRCLPSPRGKCSQDPFSDNFDQQVVGRHRHRRSPDSRRSCRQLRRVCRWAGIAQAYAMLRHQRQAGSRRRILQLSYWTLPSWFPAPRSRRRARTGRARLQPRCLGLEIGFEGIRICLKTCAFFSLSGVHDGFSNGNLIAI